MQGMVALRGHYRILIFEISTATFVLTNGREKTRIIVKELDYVLMIYTSYLFQ